MKYWKTGSGLATGFLLLFGALQAAANPLLGIRDDANDLLNASRGGVSYLLGGNDQSHIPYREPAFDGVYETEQYWGNGYF